MHLLEHGQRKFQSAGLLGSSEGLGWRGIAAELRAHPSGEIPPFQSEQLELTIAIHGEAEALVSRRGSGMLQRTAVESGAIWISPEGIVEEDIVISRDLPEILHIYLPPSHFDRLDRATDSQLRGPSSVRYLAGLKDELILQAGAAIASEIISPTPGGRLLVDALALTLSARLAGRYCESSPLKAPIVSRHPGKEDRRITRAIEFMKANLEHDVSLEAIAQVACLSTFHFARTFRTATGVAPHQFFSRLRIERARHLLLYSDRTLFDIALSTGFSSQANFTRAFRRAYRTTPLMLRNARH